MPAQVEGRRLRVTASEVVALAIRAVSQIAGRYGELAATRILGVLPHRLVTGDRPQVVRRRGLRWTGLNLGDNIQRTLYFVGVYEASTLRALRDRIAPSDTIVDVGANIGAISLPLARRLGPGGRVLAVEAAHDTADVLSANVSANGLDHVVEVHRFALSDRSGEAVLHEGEYGTDDVATRTLEGQGAATGEAVTVITGDDLLQRSGVARVDVLKIDVEGHEMAVLRGLERMFRESPPRIVVLEVVRSNQQRAGLSGDALVDHMERLGYRGQAVRFRGLRPLGSGFDGNVVFERVDDAASP